MHTRRASSCRGRIVWPTLSIVLCLLVTACVGGDPETVGTETPTGSVASGSSTTGEASSEISNETSTTSIGTSPTTSTSAVEPASESERQSTDRADATVFAEAVDATVLVVRLDSDTVLVWDSGSVIELPDQAMGYVYSDGRFLYRWAGEGGATLQASAATLDGTIICEADGRIHHATERSDGTYVVAVERDLKFEGDLTEQAEFGHPLDAVDCLTGTRQPIEPVVFYGGDGETKIIERVAGRTFTGTGDAEGNVDFMNEDGISIDGEDYAGYHHFNDDASLVAYGDMNAGAGPHFSPVIVIRDTTSGDRLATVEFEQPFLSIHFVSDRLVVTFAANFEALINGEGMADHAVVIDPRSGGRIAEVPAGFELIHLS